MEHLTQNTINVLNGNSDIEAAIEEEREEQEIHKRPHTNPRFQQFIPLPSTATTNNILHYKNFTNDRYLNTM